MEEEIKDSIHIITIVVDDDSPNPPKVDLGTMSPVSAYSLLKTVTDAIYDLLPLPDIHIDGVCISDLLYIDDDEDD